MKVIITCYDDLNEAIGVGFLEAETYEAAIEQIAADLDASSWVRMYDSRETLLACPGLRNKCVRTSAIIAFVVDKWKL